MLCADVVNVHWKDSRGRTRRAVANLDDISRGGVSLQVADPVPIGTALTVTHQNGELTGKVKSCMLRHRGYYLGIEFEPGCRWSPKSFRPANLNPLR